MKKIEKDLLLQDLDYINNEYDIKKQKLNTIISLFMDEEPEMIKDTIDESIRKKEEEIDNIIEEENKKEIEEENSEDTEPPIEDTIEENSKPELPQDIKRIYRKIVMMIHPDKNKNKGNTEIYSTLYKRVVKAKNDNDKADIIYIGYKLNIKDIYDLDDEHFGSVKRKIKEKQLESTNLTYNSFWVWYHTDNDGLKKMMANQIAKTTLRK